MINKSDVLDILNEFPEQIKEAVKLTKKAKLKIPGKISNAIICGVGVAGNAADVCSALAGKIPVFSCKDYNLPSFADKNSLVIILTYSGNSEETISAYKDAKRKKSKVVLISNKSELIKKEKKSILLPEGLIPRFSFAYLVMSAAVILSDAKIIQSINMNDILNALNQKECSRQGFLLSRKLRGKFPLVYSSPEHYSAAYRIKASINEKSKNIAFSNIITDVVYNEMMSFRKFPRKFEVILIKDENDSNEIKRHMDAFRKTLKNKNVSELELKGKTLLAKLLYGSYVGDYIAYYLALMNKEDPFKISMIKSFKENLA